MVRQLFGASVILATCVFSAQAATGLSEQQIQKVCSDGGDIFVAAMEFQCFGSNSRNNARSYVSLFKGDTLDLLGETGVSQFIDSGIASANHSNCEMLVRDKRAVAREVAERCLRNRAKKTQ